MPIPHRYDELKRKLRKLKSLERKIRFGDGRAAPAEGVAFIWSEMFGMKEGNPEKAKYSLYDLYQMGPDGYARVLAEFFLRVYDLYNRENGIMGGPLYDAQGLGALGLPLDADEEAVKARFRALAKQYHPDHGGDAERFKWLVRVYEELMS